MLSKSVSFPLQDVQTTRSHRLDLTMQSQSQAKKAKLDDDNVEGYVVDVSNPSQSKKSPNVKYFNFTLQTSPENYAKGVAFTPEKHQAFVMAKTMKSPLKLTSVTKELSFTSSSGYDVKCNRNTTLVPTKLDFAFRANTKQSQQMPIKDVIDSAAPESYVTVTAKVFHIKEPELKTTRFGKSITLTTTTIADKTAKINLALWDDDGKKLKIGKSYNLSMLTVKQFENVKSLSMTSNSAMREVDDIGHLKVDVDQEPDNAITLEGVSTTVLLVPKHFCLQCNTPITVDPERSVVSCNKCSQKMLKKNLKKTLTLKMNVKDVNITAYNDVVLNMLKDKEHLLNDPEQIEMILLETPIKVVHVNGIAKAITLA